MAVSWGLFTVDGDIEADALIRLVAQGPCGRLALPVRDQLLIVRRNREGVVRRAQWRPPRFAERLARIRLRDATYDEIDRLFDNYDLLLPSFAPGASHDLRPLGVPFQHAGHVGRLVGLAERARGDWPDDAELHALAESLETAANVCLKYGMAIRLWY